MADAATPLEVVLMTAWAHRCAMNSATPTQFGTNAARELGEVCRAFNAEIARMSAPTDGGTVYDPSTGFVTSPADVERDWCGEPTSARPISSAALAGGESQSAAKPGGTE